MQKQLGRNDPCWCGSGRKYKRCHLGRARDERPTVSESIKAFHKAQRRKVCFHPEASPEECRGDIVKAHTVPRDLLRKIARDGQVYGFPTDFGAIVSAHGVLRPALMGIGKASTFTGFCAKHDDQLFGDIEKSPILPTERHACLLSYRALCRELFAKEGGVSLDPHLGTMDRGLTVPDQVALQKQKAILMTGLSAGLKDIRERKQRYDKILKGGDYSTVKYCVIWLEQPPDVMCSCCTNPKWDFAGSRIQDLADLSTPAQGIALSLVASGQRGCAFFSWLAEEERACDKLVGSLLNLRRDRIPNAIVRFVLSSFENQFWQPEWWEGLDKPAQDALIRRFTVAMQPDIAIPPNYLCDDGLRFVDWRVTFVETNVAGLEVLAAAINAVK